MKAKIVTYAYGPNGVSLQVVPETDAEEALLKGLWAHGKTETGHPCGEPGGLGFYLTWKLEEAKRDGK